ncbi:MAG TPA: electron transport complex subunit RsxD [Gammaproteobacteria bacterium]|nr:electron transport complex subunit RsxD [Gammaproteobacteria bacterium]
MEFKTTTSSPYLEPTNDVARMMRQVLYALIPGTLAATWYFGWGVLINVMLAVLFAVALESLVAFIRGRDPLPLLRDYSAIVTAWLLALSLPQLAPWWLTLTGIFFAIVVAKHLYGGLGHNPFNPAMVGYVVLLISFPASMTAWIAPTSLAETPPGLIDTFNIIFNGKLAAGTSWDTLTMATPLDSIKTQLIQHQTISEIQLNPIFSSMGGLGWEWVANWFALGGFWLVYKRIIPWQTPLTLLLALGIPAGLFYLSNPDHFASPVFHIFSGGAMLGAFFIATDPVSGSTTPKGRIIFAAGVGLLTFIIRTWGGYPDAIAFAILLMNMATPLIDHYTQPKVFGHSKE